MTVPARRVVWTRTVRIIRTIHPPIDLFEDIADPADWEALASAEAKFNPRIRDSIGDLSKVPVARRITGPEASWVMAPFVHCAPLRPGRFSDGSFGLSHAGDRTEVAIAETIHHRARFMRATHEAPGWTSRFRELIGAIDADLDDVAARADLLDPDDDRPTQGAHFSHYWNGTAVDYVKRLDTGDMMAVVRPDAIPHSGSMPRLPTRITGYGRSGSPLIPTAPVGDSRGIPFGSSL